MIPSDLKKQLAPALNQGFVLKRAVFQPCLELYPMDQWNGLMQKIGALNQFNRKNNDFTRRFTAGVRRIDLDATGRINIPADLTRQFWSPELGPISVRLKCCKLFNRVDMAAVRSVVSSD